MLDRLRREVVLHNDRGIEAREVYLVDLLVHSRLRVEVVPPLSEALISEMFLIAWLSDRINRVWIWA